MSDTPKTDEVLREQENFGAYTDGSGDGVSPQEAYDGMVSSLEHLCRRLERENATLKQDMKVMAIALAEIEVTKASMSFLDEAFNSGDGTYRP